MCGEAPAATRHGGLLPSSVNYRDFDVSGMTVHSAGTLNCRSNWRSDGW